jgi:glycosyltransferase involved in cell wall biosynthesis
MNKADQEIKALSVFFPAYNEEQNIVQTVQKAVAVLEKLTIKWEIIIVNDGSKDDTKKVSEKIAKLNKNISVVNKENGGYGSALRAGFKASKYQWIVYTDSDGQFDFSEVAMFLKAAESADYIVGFRMKRSDPFYRLLFAKIWGLSVFLFFGVKVHDIDCGFKMINKKVLDKIPPLESERGAMINAELLIKIKKYGFMITEVGVHHYPRVAGNPTGIHLRVIIQSYLDLLKLWRKLLFV